MSAERAVNPVAAGSLLADRAYEELKGAVLANRLRPGDALSVPALAAQLSISRSPVREAVQRLIHDGLATHVPHKGAVVATVDVEDVRQLYVVREVMEGLAARLATERLDASRVAELRDLLERHEREVGTGVDERTHIEMDMAYHRMIREVADNPHLTAALDTIQGRAHLALHQLWRGQEAPRLAVAEHRRIFEAMTSGDPDAADLAARDHIRKLRIRLSQAVAPGPSGSSGAGRVRPVE
ncbi:GntR family transcriptional regulator [Streptomyces sp. NBC_00006]|uniref:GntR family transcriptional regulator n=1 Tax=unclassified Streptomyces TaxID=2593676 RepID=UPI00225892E8|nr:MULTISPECIES: GntR family transcriptional regulator [unclassified Streptomyces]MCX4833837.1 GntR family transcriptional regulator [Streptomyces sp. NBC_01016]MCX5534819.1 GntR family transcriptional regulator [Streptomyces sp. NBC_00006]